MAFQVSPDGVSRFADTTGDLARQAERARGYGTQHLAITAGQGNIFANVVAHAAELSAALDANYAHMARLMSDASAELDRCAEHYRSTDQQAAAELDATYPGTR